MDQPIDWHFLVAIFPNHIEITMKDSSLHLWLRAKVPVSKLSRRAQDGLIRGLRRSWERSVTIAISVVAGPISSDTASSKVAATPAYPRRKSGVVEARAPPAVHRDESKPVAKCAICERAAKRSMAKSAKKSAARPAQHPAQLSLFGREDDHGEHHVFK